MSNSIAQVRAGRPMSLTTFHRPRWCYSMRFSFTRFLALGSWLHDSRNWVDKYIEHLCLSAWVFPLTIISIMEKSRISLRQILGELLLTAGAVLLLFAFYEAFWTNVESGKLQEQAQEQLDRALRCTASNRNRFICQTSICCLLSPFLDFRILP